MRSPHGSFTRTSTRAQWLDRLAALARPRARCVASGWWVKNGCADTRGHAVCPTCERPVRTSSTRLAGLHVRRIKVHAA